MNDALQEVPGSSYVWFVNSSDWLASPESMAVARGNLGDGGLWWVGGLHRYRDGRVPYHLLPSSADKLAELMRTGQLGFAHPSAIMSKELIEECGGFDESLKIAADYLLALRALRIAGNPGLIRETLAIHDPTGLTSRHRLLHLKEKRISRWMEGGNRWAELSIILRLAQRTMLPHQWRSESLMGVKNLPHFCNRLVDLSWPECCVAVLDQWGN